MPSDGGMVVPVVARMAAAAAASAATASPQSVPQILFPRRRGNDGRRGRMGGAVHDLQVGVNDLGGVHGAGGADRPLTTGTGQVQRLHLAITIHFRFLFFFGPH